MHLLRHSDKHWACGAMDNASAYGALYDSRRFQVRSLVGSQRFIDTDAFSIVSTIISKIQLTFYGSF